MVIFLYILDIVDLLVSDLHLCSGTRGEVWGYIAFVSEPVSIIVGFSVSVGNGVAMTPSCLHNIGTGEPVLSKLAGKYMFYADICRDD